MKTKWLFGLMSLLLIVGLSVSAQATDFSRLADGPAAARVAGYDIASAKVELGPATAGDIDEYLNIFLDMESGSSLPGVILAEFDVDNDTGTGSSAGMLCLFAACAGGGKIKSDIQGIDIAVTIVLDEQNNCSTDWCDQCKGPGGQCFIRDTPCDPSCGSDCYKGETACSPEDSNCYVVGASCKPFDPTCDKCFEMTEQCSDDNPCAYGKIRGEWYASSLSPSQSTGAFQQTAPFYSRGRIEMPLPAQGGPGGDTSLCIKLPWRRIVNTIKYNNGVFNGNFDFEAAKDSTNTSWQIGAFEDGSSGGCDFIDATLNCLEISDAIPDAGLAAATVSADVMAGEDCEGDFTHDGDVDGDDLTIFLNSSGRSGWVNPCCH